jgi:hypothetical protein
MDINLGRNSILTKKHQAYSAESIGDEDIGEMVVSCRQHMRTNDPNASPGRHVGVGGVGWMIINPNMLQYNA